jgi:rare lipoprotein A (peptidoglycan hydrolase)
MRKIALLAFAVTLACGGFAEAHTYSHRPHHGHRVSVTTTSKTPKGEHLVRASWYGGGERLSALTASGEHFASDGLTAAHRSLPFGTRIRVTNVRTGRSAVVRINDRGPAAHTGRSLDLARGAAHAIGLQSVGSVRVVVL